jgi:hypothetical protein
MRKLFLALFAVGGLALSNAPAAVAMPTAGDVFSGATEKLTEARVFCYNRYTGRFLHWGPCGGYYRPHYYYHRYYWRPHYHYYHRYYWHRRYY